MPQFNRYIMAAGSLGIGLAIAFVMQSSAPGSAGGVNAQAAMATMPIATSPIPADSDDVDKSAASDEGALEITSVESTAAIAPAESTGPAALPETPVIKVAADPGVDTDLPSADPQTPPILACAVEMTGTARAAAIVRLDISADCMAGETVTIHHNGMMFSDVLDASGKLKVDVPALDTNAVFIAALANGEGAVAVVPVVELNEFDRVAVQWKGANGVELHAREFGADYGSDGHHWHGASGQISQAVTGGGGFLTRLGNGGISERLIAEVYTFPTGHATRSGDVVLSVESEITQENCGASVKAQTIEIKPGNAPRVQDLTLEMPTCDAVGDYLVLQTILDDLKIASK